MVHNACFNLGFLNRAVAELTLPAPRHRVVDTAPLSKALLPGRANYQLPTLATALGLSLPQHRSLGDAIAVMHVFLELARRSQTWMDEQALIELAGCSCFYG